MQILNSSQQQQGFSAASSYAVRRTSPSQIEQTTVTKDNSSATFAQTSFNRQDTVATITKLFEQLNSGEIKGWIDLEKLNKMYQDVAADPAEAPAASPAAAVQPQQNRHYASQNQPSTQLDLTI